MGRDDAARVGEGPSVTARARARRGECAAVRRCGGAAVRETGGHSATPEPSRLAIEKDLDMRPLRITAATLAALATLGLTACQLLAPSDDPSWTTQAVSIYRTEAEALDVAAGRFGPVPLALERGADLVVLGRSSCTSAAVKVRNAQGVTGWTPASGLADSGPCPLPAPEPP